MNKGSGETPTSVLRPILLHLGDPNRLSRLHTRILDVLRQVPDNGANAAVVIPSDSDPGAWTGAVSRELRRSLTAHLLGWDNIQSQRIRYAVAAFCQVRQLSWMNLPVAIRSDIPDAETCSDA